MAIYNVGGFIFTDEDEVKRAKQELQAIENIKIRTNISNPAVAKQLLYDCKTKGVFKTKVGMNFLSKLQQTAKNSVDNKQLNKSENNTPVNKRVASTDNKQFNKSKNNTSVNRKITSVYNKQFNKSKNNTPVNRRVTSIYNKQFNKSENNTPVNKSITSTDDKQLNESENNTSVNKSIISTDNKQLNESEDNTSVNRRVTYVDNRRVTYIDNRRDTYVDNGRKSDNFIYCKYCGSMVEDAAPFCPNCGKPVQPIVNISKNKNACCVASFVCGLVGFWVLPYIFSTSAIVCGIIGISTFDDQNNTNKWQCITGLVLGVIEILYSICFWYFV